MQKGFATLEVILMVMVIGILASIAVPRFTAVTAAANTAKIQSDLSTIDTAAAIYAMENENTSDTLDIKNDLKKYLREVESIKPPIGKCYVNGEEKDISETSYGVEKDDGEYRAFLQIGSDKKKAGDFTTTKSSNASGGGNSGGGTDDSSSTTTNP